MQNNFKPTGAQIEAALLVISARAYRDMVKPIFDEMEQGLLNTREFNYAPEYYRDYLEVRDDLPEDRVLTRLNDVCFLDSNQEREYYSRLDAIAKEKGFVHGSNCHSMANHELHQAEVAFIKITKNIHQLEPYKILQIEQRRKLIQLTLSLLAPWCSQVKIKRAIKEYLRGRNTLLVVSAAL